MKNWIKQVIRPTGRNALIGIGIAIPAIVAGILISLRNPIAGIALFSIGTISAVISTSNHVWRIMQVTIFNVRVGTWIALLCMVVGTVAVMRSVSAGMNLVLFGLLINCYIGKRQRTEETSQR